MIFRVVVPKWMTTLLFFIGGDLSLNFPTNNFTFFSSVATTGTGSEYSVSSKDEMAMIEITASSTFSGKGLSGSWYTINSINTSTLANASTVLGGHFYYYKNNYTDNSNYEIKQYI
jgi:hypothetical protein